MSKTYTPAFKAQVVLDLLKEEKPLAQLASEHGVHPDLLCEWKATALCALPSAFEKRDRLATARPPMSSNSKSSTLRLAALLLRSPG